MKKTTKILIIACVVGLSLLLYPTASNFWNEIHSTHAISSYVDMLNAINPVTYRELWESAVSYNALLLERENATGMTDELRELYYQTLDVTGTGVMGYIEISKIGISLPIYHGTTNEILQIAIGHVDWTSLPVGGESTHCVVSGHRGLPSAKLFTDLDSLREGDTFTLTILNEVLTYEVDQIRTVLPSQTDDLKIVEGKDYCTLVTCTPYGINTHRLLVRGHRIENAKQASTIFITAEAIQIEPLLIASILGIVDILVLIIITFTKRGSEKKRKASAKAGKSDNR